MLLKTYQFFTLKWISDVVWYGCRTFSALITIVIALAILYPSYHKSHLADTMHELLALWGTISSVSVAILYVFGGSRRFQTRMQSAFSLPIRILHVVEINAYTGLMYALVYHFVKIFLREYLSIFTLLWLFIIFVISALKYLKDLYETEDKKDFLFRLVLGKLGCLELLENVEETLDIIEEEVLDHEIPFDLPLIVTQTEYDEEIVVPRLRMSRPLYKVLWWSLVANHNMLCFGEQETLEYLQPEITEYIEKYNRVLPDRLAANEPFMNFIVDYESKMDAIFSSDQSQ